MGEDIIIYLFGEQIVRREAGGDGPAYLSARHIEGGQRVVAHLTFVARTWIDNGTEPGENFIMVLPFVENQHVVSPDHEPELVLGKVVRQFREGIDGVGWPRHGQFHIACMQCGMSLHSQLQHGPAVGVGDKFLRMFLQGVGRREGEPHAVHGA